jgi:hypothetical protein
MWREKSDTDPNRIYLSLVFAATAAFGPVGTQRNPGICGMVEEIHPHFTALHAGYV